MLRTAAPVRVLVALALIAVAGHAYAQNKPRIDRAADLPRFSYRIEGKVEDVIRSPERFAPFAAAVRRDVESVLSTYDIPDKGTQRGLIGELAALDYLEGRYDSALARVEQVRGLQDKPADKLIAFLRLKSMALAAKANGPSGERYRKAVAEAIERELAPLPYAVIENDIKGAKASAELIGETLVLGEAREVMQPIVDQSGSISSDFAPALVNARLAYAAMLPLKATLTDAFASYLAAHQVIKADIWPARAVVLEPAQARASVVIGVWDSGVDTRIFADRVVKDGDHPALIAFDKYSRPAAGELLPLTPEQQGRVSQMTARIKGFSDLQSNIDSKESAEVKSYLSGLTPEQYRPAIEELGLATNYTHGTHVAGIAMAGNPSARLVVARIEFGHTLKPDPCPSLEQSQRDAKAAQAYVDYLKREKVRVVNMSWGGGVADIESDLEKCGIGKTADERKALARQYFEIQKKSLSAAFSSAPEILFVAAAGNGNNDASFVEYVPSGIVLPNLLTVGAVDSAGEEAPFTSYGPTVKVHANGYQVESFLPGGSRIAMSGTSMASPQVANLAGKLVAINPKLSPTELIRIIIDTADRTADGRRNLVNPKKALAAAGAA
jgi:subtilisin family serine protease